MTTIRLRRGTSTQWDATNPVLGDGEPGWDATTRQVRIGDGITEWGDLPPANTAVRSRATASTTFMLQATDVGCVVETTANTAVAVTVPAGVAGDVTEVCQYGTGQVTLAGDSGVTLRSASGLKTRAQYSAVVLRWRTATEVLVNGDLTT